MRVTQGTFAFLPDFTDEQIAAQVRYCLANDWPVSIEYTDDPHPRNTYWEMWGLPMFDQTDPAAIVNQLDACRRAHAESYVRLTGYDRSYGRQTTAISFIVARPTVEPDFRLDRAEGRDRQIRYSMRPEPIGQLPARRGDGGNGGDST